MRNPPLFVIPRNVTSFPPFPISSQWHRNADAGQSHRDPRSFQVLPLHLASQRRVREKLTFSDVAATRRSAQALLPTVTSRARTCRYPWRSGGERSRVAVAAAQLSAMTAGTGGAGGSRVVESGGSGDSREWEMGEGRMRGGRVNIVPRQEAVEEKRASTAARGVRVGEVVRGSGVEEGGLAGASHMTVREGEHVERGCAAGVGARAAAGRGDSAAAEERGTTGPHSHAHAQPAPTCADLPALGAVTPGSAPTLGAAHPWSHAPFSVDSHRSAHADACASMEGHLCKEPSLLVFSGGTAFNAVAEELHEWTTAVAHVLPVSDDGGSTAEIVRVIGGPAIGDIRSRCLRLSDGSSHEARAVRRLLGHRLPLHPAHAKAEWLSIVEGEHELWGGVSDPYKEIIRAFLLHFHYQVLLLHFHCQVLLVHFHYQVLLVHFHYQILRNASHRFCFQHGSVGNFFFSGARAFFRSLDAAIFLFSRVSNIPQRSLVLPCVCTNDRFTLGAELYDGSIIRGQNEISHPAVVDSPRHLLLSVDKVALLPPPCCCNAASACLHAPPSHPHTSTSQVDGVCLTCAPAACLPLPHVCSCCLSSSPSRVLLLPVFLSLTCAPAACLPLPHVCSCCLSSSPSRVLLLPVFLSLFLPPFSLQSSDASPPLPAPIRRVFYMSSEGTNLLHEVFPRVNPRVLEQIASVDAIIYGIGSLFTSICPSLVPTPLFLTIFSFSPFVFISLTSCSCHALAITAICREFSIHVSRFRCPRHCPVRNPFLPNLRSCVGWEKQSLHAHVPRYGRVHQNTPRYGRVHQNTPRYGRVHQNTPRYGRVHQNTPRYGRVHQNAPRYGRVHQNTPRYGRVHQNTPRYGRVHQNTPRYGRVHQNTPRYGRVHQNTQDVSPTPSTPPRNTSSDSPVQSARVYLPDVDHEVFKHFRRIKVDEGKSQQYECRYCCNVFSGAATRCAQHLANWRKMRRREVALCKEAPSEVRAAIRKKYEAKAAAADQRRQATSDAIASVTSGGKRSRITDYLETDAAAAKRDAHEALALMFAACRIPERVAAHPLFINAVCAIRDSGTGYVPPTRTFIDGAGLRLCCENIDRGLSGVKASWKRTGVTISSDMMTDKNGRPQANVFLVNESGAVFKDSVDCRMETKTGGYVALSGNIRL
ncbi:unnamed protein product [Closterium sp. NIES-64]|nr:unnamed protein product [Closterium sp. NIES-64]